MSRRKKIVLAVVGAACIVVAVLLAHPCRDPDPPDHPVPVDHQGAPADIAAP